MTVKNYKELIVWQKAMELVRLVYAATDGFPKNERYALADQLVRAAVSVPSNIAEGFGRQTNKDFAHFLSQARGSLYEAETQLIIAFERHYIESFDAFSSLIDELGRIINGLISKLKLTTNH